MSNRVMVHAPFQKNHLSNGGLQFSFEYDCVDCGSRFSANSGFAKRCNACKGAAVRRQKAASKKRIRTAAKKAR